VSVPIRKSAQALMGVAVALIVSGCSSFGGLNSYVLPGAIGTGHSGYTIEVELRDAGNLVPNSEVKFEDVTVGTVLAIDLDDWHARAKVGLRKDVPIPSNVEARIGQKSVLGALYLELAPPPNTPPVGTLRDGDVIGLERSGAYPTTEELLSSLSLLLNGGGLAQAQTIVAEVNNTLDGNGANVRELVDNLNRFIGSLDAQRQQIVQAIDSVEQLSTRLAARSAQFGVAIDHIDPGLQVLNEQRSHLIEALDAMNRLGVVGTRVIGSSKELLVGNLRDLQPTLAKIAEAGDAVPKSLDLAATIVLPIKAIPYVTKGDYLNIAVTLDLSIPALAGALFPGTPVEKALKSVQTALTATDPLTGPLNDTLNSVTGAVVVGQDPSKETWPDTNDSKKRPAPSGGSGHRGATWPPTNSPAPDPLLGPLVGGR
jgi:phospholipid/cholesterol/gamma-HCH transport system substrate-binding protein